MKRSVCDHSGLETLVSLRDTWEHMEVGIPAAQGLAWGGDMLLTLRDDVTEG